jgi:tetrahydromethanopterin S-methyltransferase subunit B
VSSEQQGRTASWRAGFVYGFVVGAVLIALMWLITLMG